MLVCGCVGGEGIRGALHVPCAVVFFVFIIGMRYTHIARYSVEHS